MFQGSVHNLRELTLGLAGVIPHEAKPRLRIADEVVQLDVGLTVVRVALLVVPAQTEIQLHGFRNFEFILNVMAEHSCTGIGVELEIANACTEPDEERIIVRFICRNRTGRPNGQPGWPACCR